MRTDGSDLHRITHDSTNYAVAMFSPDGQKLLAWSQTSDGSDEIFLMNLDGSNLANLSRSPGDDNDALFNPDGTSIVFVSTRDGHREIYAMDANGLNQKRVTWTTDDDSAPESIRSSQRSAAGKSQRTTAHSPQFTLDGSKILYCTTAADENVQYPFDNLVMNYRLYFVNVDGGGRQAITGESGFYARMNELNNETAGYLKPGISKDGTRLVFVSYIPNTTYFHKLYMLDSLTGRIRLLLTGDIQTPLFAPNDPMLIITSHAEGKFDLYEVSTRGTGLRMLTSGVSGHVALSEFSSDGSRILFDTDILTCRKIWVMNRDGSAATQLTFGKGNDVHPRYQPVQKK